MATATYDVAVVGGGIVGAACAFALGREGLTVLLIDRGEPQRAASWGNAGHFAYEQVLPLATPGLWAQLPRLLFGRQSPLSIPLWSLLTLAPWLVRFAWSTRSSQAQRATAALASLLAAAPEAWRRLADVADLQALMRTGRYWSWRATPPLSLRGGLSWRNFGGMEPPLKSLARLPRARSSRCFGPISAEHLSIHERSTR